MILGGIDTPRNIAESNSEGVELTYSKKVIQQTVICFGLTKFITALIYLALFVAVYNSEVEFGAILQGLLLLAIIPSYVHGAFLIYAGMRAVMWAINASLWMALGIGAFDVLLGVFGACAFVKNSKYTRDFLIQICFWVLAFNMIRVLCIDVIILLMYKKIKKQEGIIPITDQFNVTISPVYDTNRTVETPNAAISNASPRSTSPPTGVTNAPGNKPPSPSDNPRAP